MKRSGEPQDLEQLVHQANVEYHDRIANQYESDASTVLYFAPEVQRKIEKVVKLLRDCTEGYLWVDVGCGTGNVLKFADRYFGVAVGFDISAGMLRLSKERHLDVGLASAQAMPIRSDTVDVVSAFSVLHHMFDPEPALAEIYRVLKPGGYFYDDLDPNGLCLIRRPPLRAAYRLLYKWYLQVTSCVPQSNDVQDAEIARLENMAEYHQSQTLGLDPQRIAATMQELGFRDVKIYLSFGTLDPERFTQRKGKQAGWVLIAPLFSIIAQK